MNVLDDQRPADDKYFMKMSGFVLNYSDQPVELHDIDFRLTYTIDEESHTVIPSTQLMSIYRDNFMPGLEYPDRNIPLYPDFIIDPRRLKQTVLIYEIHEGADLFHMAFAASMPNLSFVLIPVEQTHYSRVYKLSDTPDVVLNFTFDEPDNRRRISDVIDIEDVTVDNCFGSTQITRSFTFSQQQIALITIGEDRSVSVAPVLIPFINEALRINISNHHNRLEGSILTSSRTESLSASPGTRPSWRLMWYLETIEGTASLTLGEDVYFFPYTINDRLRSDLVSVPGEPCPTQ